MKTPSSYLHDLVSRLTKSEKRYIRLKAGSGEKDYLALFDALLAQDVYDEERLVREHAGANFVRHLAANKRYLYDLILKSLASFGQKKVEDQVVTTFQAVGVLLEKGLLKAARKELNKGLRMTERYELFEWQLLLLGLEKQLLAREMLPRSGSEGIDRVRRLELQCLEQLSNANAYWYLFRRIAQCQLRYQKIQTPEQREEVERIVNEDIFRQPALATNVRGKLYYHQANVTYQFMQGRVTEAYAGNRDLLDLLERQPSFLKIYAELYLATLNNLLIDSLTVGEYELLEAGIARLERTLERPEFKTVKHLDVRVFRQRYLLLLNWSLSRGEFAGILPWLPEVEAGLARFGKKIERHHRITFYYLIAYSLWQNGRPAEALTWNNRLLADTRREVVREIFYFARVLELLIHYEMGNHALLESLLQSTPKYLKSKRPVYATEKALFRFLQDQIRSVDKRERRARREHFAARLRVLADDPKERRMFSYLDLRHRLSG